MHSYTPFADPTSYSLPRHLTDTTIGPAEMCALASVFYTDADVVDALCDHAKGSFCQLVALFAATQEPVATYRVTASKHNRDRFRDRVVTYVVNQVRDANEANLLTGLGTARTVFTGSCLRPYRTGPLYVSELFAEHAPLASLTDKVVAEMALRFPQELSPGLGLLPRRSTNLPGLPFADRFVSRYLLDSFGFHGPSWTMFKQVHTPEATIGDIVDLVAAVEQKRRPASLT